MTPPGRKKVATYEYRDTNLKLVFSKIRLEWLDEDGKRQKTFRYLDAETRTAIKPLGADGLIYRLPSTLASIERGAPIHWTEGEKDADAVVRAGRAATSHHQGAGHVTQAQADWLKGAKSVWIWMDVDYPHPEVGAYDAAVRNNRLLNAGLHPRQIRIVRAAKGKDAFDHLAQGLRISDAVRVTRREVFELAREYRRSSVHKTGYDRD